MDIDKKDRSTLKSYFRKNSIPTESNFADLIDGMLNQKDDGIVKLPGDPLSIAAAGDAAGPQKVINFYGNLAEANPVWMLQLNPRSDQNKPETSQTGFSISDGQGVSRLFIDKSTGNVGIGTIHPQAKLDIEGGALLGYESTLSDFGTPLKSGFYQALNATGDVSDTAHDWSHLITARHSNTGNNHQLQIAATFKSNDRLFFRKIQAVGTENPVWNEIATRGSNTFSGTQVIGGILQVNGVIGASSSSTPPTKGTGGVPVMTSGIRFGENPGGGGYDAAWIQYYARSGESCTLEIGVSNDADDHIALMPSGNVGVGTNNPSSKLTVVGSIAGGETSTGWVLGKGAWGPDNWLRITTLQSGNTYHDLAINSLWSAGVKRFDLAEITPVKLDDDLEQGDVVVIDRENGLRVTRSTKPGDTAVYGIVSSFEQAAIVIGGVGGPEVVKGEKDVAPIALIGRVIVKASDENGPITIGDLLTTSATRGHVMRCDDRTKYAGAIIGKALEPLNSGKGVITVLVSMQ